VTHSQTHKREKDEKRAGERRHFREEDVLAVAKTAKKSLRYVT